MGKWKPGTSGNPSGRPIKNRALTEILKKAGDKTIKEKGKDRGTARKRLVAELVWQLVTTGKAKMPDGTELRLDPKDWIGTVKWIYKHIDGDAKAELDLTSGGEKIDPITIIEVMKDATVSDSNE